jgi:hypothetical protein
MTRWLVSWLNGLTALELALVFVLSISLLLCWGIVLVHPLMRRMVHGKRQVNDIMISVAANFWLVHAALTHPAQHLAVACCDPRAFGRDRLLVSDRGDAV